jgi:hypothetical protein
MLDIIRVIPCALQPLFSIKVIDSKQGSLEYYVS